MSWRHWLLEKAEVSHAAAVLERHAAGPMLALLTGASLDGAACWACARPAHLAAALDHVRLAEASALALADDDVAELMRSLNSHFADRGYTFERGIDVDWLLRCAAPVDSITHDPAAVAGRNVHDFMPAGRDGARVRGLMNEVQMLLHEHPVNERRQRRGDLAINAVWPWGFGAPRPASAHSGPDSTAPVLQLPPLHTDDAWMRGLWQVHRAAARAWTAQWSVHDSAGTMFIAVTKPGSARTEAALSMIENDLLFALRERVAQGRVGDVSLLLGSRVLRVPGSARFAFWRRPVAGTQWLQQ
jgi:hypothetical protein